MGAAARIPLALAIAFAGIWFGFGHLTYPFHHAAAWGSSLLALIIAGTPPRKLILRFGRLGWTINELCRHVLVTGDTGCGKTSSGFHTILVQLTQNVPNWGGLVLGVKGDEHEFIAPLLSNAGRCGDLIHLEVKPANAAHGWEPTHRYNLLSDRGLPWTTHAKAVVDTAASLTAGRQDSFFKPMAQIALAHAFELLDEIGDPVTLTRAYEILTSHSTTNEALDRLEAAGPTAERIRLAEFFCQTFLDAKAPEQREGIEGTIKTYLSFFRDPDIASVFSSDKPNTFEMDQVDRGAVIAVSMPQRFVTERRYVNTYLKMLFFYHALRRYELPKAEQAKQNLLLLVADEYQDIVTATEDGISDHKIVDRIRGANCAIVAGMQSEVSADPAIGRDKRKVLALNFRTRLVFRAADMEGATASADFIGKKMIWKRSRSSKALSTVTYSKREEEDHRIKPAKLMELKDHRAVIVHPSKRFIRTLVRPLDALGKVPGWFRG